MDGIGKWMLHAVAAGLCAHALQCEALYDPSKEYVEAPRVAARYPDPDSVIPTPAFKPGKPDFTSQEELQAFVDALSRRSPDLRVRIIGSSQEARAIPLLIFARPSPGDGGDLAKAGKPTVLIIGQQHGNEPAGGEAALALRRSWRMQRRHRILDQINVLIVPRANPDGADPFRPRFEEWRRRQPRPPAREHPRGTRAGQVSSSNTDPTSSSIVTSSASSPLV